MKDPDRAAREAALDPEAMIELARYLPWKARKSEPEPPPPVERKRRPFPRRSVAEEARAVTTAATGSLTVGVSGTTATDSTMTVQVALPAPRRLEFIGAGSRKFWEIRVVGSEHHLRWGRIGTAGQTLVKRFSTPRVANLEAEKVITSKLRKGYREVG